MNNSKAKQMTSQQIRNQLEIAKENLHESYRPYFRSPVFDTERRVLKGGFGYELRWLPELTDLGTVFLKHDVPDPEILEFFFTVREAQELSSPRTLFFPRGLLHLRNVFIKARDFGDKPEEEALADMEEETRQRWESIDEALWYWDDIVQTMYTQSEDLTQADCLYVKDLLYAMSLIDKALAPYMNSHQQPQQPHYKKGLL